MCLLRTKPTTTFFLQPFQPSHAGTLTFYVLTVSFGSHSNSCTSDQPWVYRRCLYTVARCMGKLAPSVAWPETLIAPGTAPNAQDTFQLPRGRSMHTLNTLCLSSLASHAPLRKTLPLYYCRHMLEHLGIISTPAVWCCNYLSNALLKGISAHCLIS